MNTLMKKYSPLNYILFTSVFLFALVSTPAFSQGWQWQNPKPTGHILNDVQFINTSTGWAVGQYGTILHTTDGGTNWIVQNSGTTLWLEDLTFLDENNGWVVGDTILHTTNGGATWVGQSCGISGYPEFGGVSFTSLNNGWTSGVVYDTVNYSDSVIILYTTNGGAFWSRYSFGFTGYLYDIAAIDSNNVWAVGSQNFVTNDSLHRERGVICHTTDAGTSWQTQYSDSTGRYTGLQFTDATHGWIIGSFYSSLSMTGWGTVLRTTNGGTNWESVQVNADSADELVNMSFTDATHGWIVGRNGYGSVVASTTNGGSNWRYLQLYGEHLFGGVSFPENNEGWIVSFYGLIQHSTDGGLTWQVQTHGTTDDLTDIQCVDENTAWALGNGYVSSTGEYWCTLVHTTDGGNSWNKEPAGRQNNFSSISFINNTSIGWALGDAWNDSTGQYDVSLFRTTDGGEVWSVFSHPPSGGEVKFVDLNNGWIVDSYGDIYHTSDGGINWTRQQSGTNGYYFLQAEFADSNHGWVVTQYYNQSNNYNFLRTSDGGDSWTTVPNFAITGFEIMSIKFIDANQGWLVENGSSTYSVHIRKTTDGGLTWSNQYEINQDWASAITFSDTCNGWVFAGYWNYHTTNGGLTWNTQETGGAEGTLAAAFVNPNVGWEVGYGGAILHTTDGGETFVASKPSSKLPTHFSLEQNYPNPFNARTFISYTLPTAGKVTLEVFDVTGRKVATLMNGFQNPGRNRVPFDGTKLATGVYFYRLNVNGVSESRKMILMK